MADRQAQILTDYVVQCTGADRGNLVAFKRLSGGAIQDNFALTVELSGGSHPGRQELVVRQDAPSSVQTSLSRPQEFRILEAAWDAGMSAPEPLWLCQDLAVTGQIFYVMTRARGTASPPALVKADYHPDTRRALTRQMGEELARLHQIRPPRPALDFLTVPPGNPALTRVGTYRDYLADIPEAHPVLEWALNWLEDHHPPAADPVLCHCDFRTGNFMVDEGRITAVLDWEFASWSDPMEDLGWLCSRSWRFGAREREVGGIGDKVDLFAGYEAISGTQVDAARVQYWEVMALVRWSMIALQQAQRHLSGEQPSLELALTGRKLPEMEYDLLKQIQELGL